MSLAGTVQNTTPEQYSITNILNNRTLAILICDLWSLTQTFPFTFLKPPSRCSVLNSINFLAREIVSIILTVSFSDLLIIMSSWHRDECLKVEKDCVGDTDSDCMRREIRNNKKRKSSKSRHGVQRAACSACMQEAGSFQQAHLLPNKKFKQVKEII